MSCLLAWFLMMVCFIVMLVICFASMIWEEITGKDFGEVMSQKLSDMYDKFEERFGR